MYDHLSEEMELVHQPTGHTLLSNLQCHLAETLRKLEEASDPVEKEKRVYPVNPSLVYLSIIGECIPADLYDEQWESRFEAYLSLTREDLLGDVCRPQSRDIRSLGSWLRSPIDLTLGWLHGDPSDYKLLTVKCSRRTLLKGKPMTQHVRRALRHLTETHGRIPTLTDLTDLLKPELAQCACLDEGQDLHPGTFIRNAVETTMMGMGATPPYVLLRNLPERPYLAPNTLRMRTKLYVNRADRRAYYVDTDVTRHVCGSILQALLLPAPREVRIRMMTESWLPSFGKNILSKTLEIPRGFHLHVLFGDVSSFTNNDINVWLSAIALLYMMRSDADAEYYRLIANVCGYALDVDVRSVLETYVLLTVQAPSLDAHGEQYTAPGGYLGVKANMTLTTLAFAIRLEAVSRAISRLTQNRVTLTGQVGGDDFVLFMWGPNENELKDLGARILSEIRSTSGQLKDPKWEMLHLETPTHGQFNSEFCKKGVGYSVTPDVVGDSFFVQVGSLRKLPLMGQLVVRPIDKPFATNRFRHFDVQMGHYFREFPEADRVWFHNAYLEAYRDYYHHSHVVMTRYTVFRVDESALRSVDGRLVTNGALRVLLSTPTLATFDGEYHTGTSARKVSLLLSREILRQSEFPNHTAEKEIPHLSLESETHHRLTKTVRHVIRVHAWPSYTDVSDLFKAFRHDIARLFPNEVVVDSDVDNDSDV